MKLVKGTLLTRIVALSLLNEKALPPFCQKRIMHLLKYLTSLVYGVSWALYLCSLPPHSSLSFWVGHSNSIKVGF